MTTTERPLPIAVIGAGFSGTMTAIHLLATLPPERAVLLCEREGAFARGLAYATGNPDHLLNLRASNMSAFPDRPGHFEAWLADSAFDAREASGIRRTAAGTFAARGLYGRYLTEILTAALTGGDGPPRLRLVPDAAIDLDPGPEGFTLTLAGGRRHAVAGAVLAMGNLGPTGAGGSRHRLDPWALERFGPHDPDRPMLIIGTGLTMVDAVASLRRHGFAGPVIAVSRRGLVPNPHAPTAPWPLPDLSAATRASVPDLLARIRAEIAAAAEAGVDWRGVIDALRPITGDLWRGLPTPERARFLRHLRPFWDVHRHRTAPPSGEAIAEEIGRGTVRVLAGRIDAVEEEAAQAVVTVKPRGGGPALRLPVQGIIDATGIASVTRTGDPLVQRLLDRGLVRPGPLGLGVDAGLDCRVAGAGRLWAIGPLLRGVLWECIAVPDIRTDAAQLARVVGAALAEPASGGAAATFSQRPGSRTIPSPRP